MFLKLGTSFCASALLVVPHCVQEDIEQADQVGGSGRVLRVELNTVREINHLKKKMHLLTSDL